MNSKKKRRHQAWIKRQDKKSQIEVDKKIMKNGTPEEMATVMGIKLK